MSDIRYPISDIRYPIDSVRCIKFNSIRLTPRIARWSSVTRHWGPGIGKSTLLLQAAAHFANGIGTVLYSSGEESEHQIKSRGERLGAFVDDHARAPLYLLAETCLERILEEIARLGPSLVIVDSIQTVSSFIFQSAAGAVGAVC